MTEHSLKPNPPKALYQEIKQHILDKIDGGIWQVNERLPSEHELVAQFGFSRMTINRALRELTDEGYLVRIQGVGTFVAPPKAQSALFEIHSIADEIESRGHQHHCKLLTCEEVKANAELALSFKMADNSPLFHTQMVHFEDNVAIQYEDRWVNPMFAPNYLQQDFNTTTAHDYLTTATPINEGEHIVEAVLPPKPVYTALNMPKGEPCLVMQRRTWSRGGVVTFVRLWFPSSRYRLVGRFTT